MEKVRLIIIVLAIVCAIGFLGDFLINSAHPYAELAAGLCFLVAVFGLIIDSVRVRKK